MLKQARCAAGTRRLRASSSAGCNTIEGAGKDIKAGGAAIEKAADQAKKY